MLLLQIILTFAFIWFLLGFLASQLFNVILKHSPLDTDLWPSD